MSEATIRLQWVASGWALVMGYWTFEFGLMNGTIKLEDSSSTGAKGG